jgi:hypothetical protein
MTKKPGAIEGLLNAIPGYAGYVDREERRITDKMLRDQIAASLDRMKPRLDEAIRALTAKGALDAITEIDRVRRKLSLCADLVRHAQYGESGFFDVVKIGEAELDRLYMFDLDLKGKVDAIVERVGGLPGAEKPADACQELCRALDDLAGIIRNREQCVLEIE